MMLAVIMSVTVLPQSVTSVHAATGYASLANIGQLGTVNIGNKSVKNDGQWKSGVLSGFRESMSYGGCLCIINKPNFKRQFQCQNSCRS